MQLGPMANANRGALKPLELPRSRWRHPTAAAAPAGAAASPAGVAASAAAAAAGSAAATAAASASPPPLPLLDRLRGSPQSFGLPDSTSGKAVTASRRVPYSPSNCATARLRDCATARLRDGISGGSRNHKGVQATNSRAGSRLCTVLGAGIQRACVLWEWCDRAL